MLFGITMFATDYAIRPDDLLREAEAGLRIALAARAYSHPGKSAQPLARAAAISPKSTGTVTICCRFDRRCCSHKPSPHRERNLSCG